MKKVDIIHMIIFSILSIDYFILAQEVFQFNKIGEEGNEYYANMNSNLYKIEPTENICHKPGFWEWKRSVIIIGAGVSGISTATYLRNSGLNIDIKILEGRNRFGGRVNTDTTTFSAPMDFGGFMFFIDESNPLNYFIKLKNITLEPTTEGAKNPKIFWPADQDEKDYDSISTKLKAKVMDSISHLDEEEELTYDELKEIVWSKNNLTDMEKYIYFRTINVTYFSQTNIEMRDVRRIKAILNITNHDRPSISYMKKGYFHLFDHLTEGLDVKFNTTIVKIDRNDDNVTVYDSEGKSYTADHVISTIPLAVMQSGLIDFVQELSIEKQELFQVVPVGVFNKIIVEFEEKFWGEEDGFAFYDRQYKPFDYGFSFEKVNGKPIVIFPYSNEKYQSLAEFSLEIIEKEITEIMKEHYPGKNVKIVAIKKSDWGNEIHSKGTFSCFYNSCVAEFFDMLSEPEGRLHFAGEHTQRGFNGRVRGAWMSGYRAATEIMNTFKNMC
jgi:polyamine oxidase